MRRDLAQPPAGEEQREARPQRQQPHPQQQRALLRATTRQPPGRTVGVVVDECSATTAKLKSARTNAELEDRERDASARPPGRTPPGGRTPPTRCAARAAMERHADPVGLRSRGRRRAGSGPSVAITSVLPGGELRRALGDQRVGLADEAGAPPAHGDDHLAPVAEGIGHRARVADRHRSRARAVAHAEAAARRRGGAPSRRRTLPVSW